MEEGIASAILQIVGLSIIFFLCSLLCYCLCTQLLKEEACEFLHDVGKDDQKPPTEGWDAKHYYDPLPTAISPPEIICRPSEYSFKLQNGKTPHALPHAVINPAVLQYPPGHILEERNIKPQHSTQHSRSGSRNSSKVSPSLKNETDKGKSSDQRNSKGNEWISTIA